MLDIASCYELGMRVLREWWIKRSPHFLTEVRIEVNYLREVYGAEAYKQAMERANDPRVRSFRRMVAQEAAKVIGAPEASRA